MSRDIGVVDERAAFEVLLDCKGFDFFDNCYWLRAIPECPDEKALINADWELWQAATAWQRAALSAPNHGEQALEIERALYEQSCKERAASNGRVYEAHYFKRSTGVGEYLNPAAEHGWQVWQQARAALSAPNHSEQVREAYHTLPEIDLIMLAEQFVISTGRISISALQRNFRIDYHKACRVMEALELRDVVSAMDEFGHRTLLAAAPSAGSQKGEV